MTLSFLAACSLVLLASGVDHLRRRDALLAGLRRQGVVPDGLVRPVSWALPLGEVALGVGLLAAVMDAGTLADRTLGGATVALFAAFAVYLRGVSRRPDAHVIPCACGSGETSVGPWVTLRAATLGALAALGALWPVAGGLGSLQPPQVAVVVSASVALAVTLALLPAARQPQIQPAGGVR